MGQGQPLLRPCQADVEETALLLHPCSSIEREPEEDLLLDTRRRRRPGTRAPSRCGSSSGSRSTAPRRARPGRSRARSPAGSRTGSARRPAARTRARRRRRPRDSRSGRAPRSCARPRRPRACRSARARSGAAPAPPPPARPSGASRAGSAARDRLDGGGAEARLHRAAERLVQRQAVRVRVGDEPRDRRVADPALGAVRDPHQADRVGRVVEHLQVGDRVLHLGPLVEARPADHLVGDLVQPQRLLQHRDCAFIR